LDIGVSVGFHRPDSAGMLKRSSMRDELHGFSQKISTSREVAENGNCFTTNSTKEKKNTTNKPQAIVLFFVLIIMTRFAGLGFALTL
jgi:hypothetical protein